METALPFILYGLDIMKYWMGNRLFFEGRMKRPWLAAAGGAGLFTGIAAFSLTGTESTVFAFSAAMVISGIMIEGMVSTKAMRIVWLYCIATPLNDAMGVLFRGILGAGENTYIAGSVSTLMVISIGGYALKKFAGRFTNKKLVFSVLYAMLILICLSIGFSTTAVKFMFETLPPEKAWINPDFITIASLIAITLLAVLIFYVQKLYDLLDKSAATERNLKQIQAAYYQSLLEQEEETRRYRHDMHNHLLVAMELAQAENAGHTTDYIKNLEKKLNKICEKRHETGNMILNILLHHYLSEKDVKVSVKGICTRELHIDDVDFCTVFSNLIQNAAEELERLEETEKFFSMEILQGKDYTQITLRNSTRLLLDTSNHKLKTSKKDKVNHGIGFKNITDTIKKYEGELLLGADGKEFKAVVTMKI